MKNAICFALLGLCVLYVVGCAGEGTADPDAGQPYVESEVSQTAYLDLVMGGSLYVGTVRWVHSGRIKQEMGYSAPELVEYGIMQFKVEKTLWGDKQDNLPIPYARTREDLSAAPQPTDWGGGHLWDGKRPVKGQRLMLLVNADKNGTPVPTDLYGEEWPVRTIWRLRADDPLVPAFEEATRYLSGKNPERRREIFQSLCRSRLKNIRGFASYVAFGDIVPDKPRNRDWKLVDQGAKSELVLDFLRYAGPVLEDDERLTITNCFADWLDQKTYAERATDELRGAFEDWYLTELACAAVPERRAAAVQGLVVIATTHPSGGLGASDTVKLLFKKGGRGPLLKRLEECSHSPDEKVKEKSEELLKLFREP